MGEMNCYKCATPLPDNSRFCLSCGAVVSGDTSQPAATAGVEDAAALEMERSLREATAGEYEIERELGRGGMAVVYLATEIHLSRKVAIKVLPRELTFGKGFVERFRREAQTAAALDHPHIIPIYRIASGGKLLWYAMKYIEGRSLAEILVEKPRLSLEETITILSPVAEALDYAHEHKVIHRDVKPANVMIDPRGRVLVTDFGIAKAVGGSSLTGSGAAIGTPYYMSPEQCAGTELAGAADQYSLGVMAYQMLSGQVPFEGDSPAQLIHKHCTMPPPPLDVLRPGMPSHVYQAIHRAMEKKPAQRFPTVSGFVEAMKFPDAATRLLTPAERAGRARPISITLEVVRLGLLRALPWRFVAPVAVLATVGVGYYVVVQARGGASPPSLPTRAGRASTAERPGATDTGGVLAVAAPPAPRPGSPRGSEGSEAPATQPSRQGQLALLELPSGASVRIDGRPRAGTLFSLPAGRHELAVSAPGYEARTETVRVTAGDTLRHRARLRALPTATAAQPATQGAALAGPPAAPQVEDRPVQPTPMAPEKGELLIRLNVWANISVNGVPRRQSAVYVDSLPPGPHAIRAERSGYVTIDTTALVEAGARREVRLEMRRVTP